MLFVMLMKSRYIYIIGIVVLLVILVGFLSFSNKDDSDFSERVKISLRDAGNQLLLSNKDTTSVILPVIQQGQLKYRLSFENPLLFNPSKLVSAIDSSFQKGKLKKHYRVEVIQCTDKEVAYSFAMSEEVTETIIPCAGRFLPEECYSIEVKFTNQKASFLSGQGPIYILVFAILALLGGLLYNIKSVKESNEANSAFAIIGSFKFYPDQNVLIKEAVEISLSKKECELLAIFVAHPNQIIKRDELSKKVWEDNGVFVGRSLDTYISKLRKKLQDDDSIKLTNVHGVGYKLEI